MFILPHTKKRGKNIHQFAGSDAVDLYDPQRRKNYICNHYHYRSRCVFSRNALQSLSIPVQVVSAAFFPQLRVSSGFAYVNHSFPSSVTLLHLVKGLRNPLKAERLVHHGPNLSQTKQNKTMFTTQKLFPVTKLSVASK